MKRPDALRALAVGAALVTIALTAVAFWLSYEHLHDVAHSNGLRDSARSWAWPATVDMFIVIGELLMLRASLRGRVDWWAIGLAASGSLGSIALNVAGVGMDASPMEYVVAAVPPVAALLAFGALMRQVHEALARATANPAAPAMPAPPAPASAPAKPLPVAGASRVPAPASLGRQPTAKPQPATARERVLTQFSMDASVTPPPPVPPAKDKEPEQTGDVDAGRDLAEVAEAYRKLREDLKKHRPSAAELGKALGLSRSRGQQLREQLETHPDYKAEFAPALKSA